MRGMYVQFNDEEFIMLSEAAFNDCRHPRDQARHFIRQALGLVSSQAKHQSKTNSSTVIRQDCTGAAVEINP